ncbi:synaptotagmin-like protein 2 isoform X11 [Hyperolius riggenbachi]|uniref:synaptotagmin-like protein 2 isoform X11 n=1 Tax=Hyperolius riggenbachi TaxID=752182 RepID=UPI0035A331C1
MIDLSFLTEAEQESILKVLNRDSELKKAEDERVRQLHNAVDDENEFKYKSGQWFYDAKSRRHRDKVHGADLVRASIRKRKKPQTLAELSESNKDYSKRRWVNSVNQDIFIPPELSGVIMEAPDEAEEDIALKKEAGTESSNKVNDTTSPEKGPDTLKNGAVPSSKQRLNPFNTEGLKDETDYKNEPPSLTPEIEATKPPKSKSDIMSSLAKYGVRLPYAADLPKGPQVSSKAKDDDHAQNQAVPPPVPKPRTLRMNGQQDASNSSLKSEDSFNGMHKPRGILKRRSSSSSTDSESIRIAQTLEANKIVLPGSPILEAGQNNFFDEQDSTSDNSSDRLKQVRFSEKVHQRPPTPTPDAYSVREIGEYGILDPGLLLSDLDSGFDDHHGSEDSFPGQYSDSAGGYNDSTKAPQQNATSKSQGVSLAVQPQSLEVERNQVNLEEEKSQKNNKLIKPETNSDISLELPDSHSTGLNALYAAVRKTPPATSPQQSQDKNPEVASPEALNSKPDQINASSPTEDTTGPVENSFPENAEKFKRMSQSVPAFLQDEICPCAPDVLTDGRDTDSASESSFQIGRHKKSPSSLTNLSGSSGMASMSSVSGSVMSVYSGDFGNVDVKGGIEFQVVYMDQLKEFFIYVYQCKDLAAADVKKQRSDPYVKAYLLPEKAKMGKRKTAVKKKTLDPVYNEILKYKIPKQSLLAQTLNLSVWHHDALGRNSFLGEVNLNLATVDWDNKDRAWYQLQPRTPSAGIGLENRGEMKLSLKYVPRIPSETNTKAPLTGEVHIWIRECVQLPKLRDKINSFVKCTVLPDTSRKSRQKTRTVDKTPNPIFNHTMVYDGFKTEDLREACVELTVWDHNRLSNHFLGGLRIGLGSGKSYGTVVDWMDSTHEESTMWEKMMASPNIWVDGMLPLRMFKMAKLAK